MLRILHHNHYQGVLIPDHTPLPECAAPGRPAGPRHGLMKAAYLIEREGA
jgi:hypothetical protein